MQRFKIEARHAYQIQKVTRQMKVHYSILLVVALVAVTCNSKSDASGGNTSGDEYDFWVTLEQAQAQALDEGKYILLDIYTEWCGFCRRMNKETYADTRVQEALDRYFYPVRIDAESANRVTFHGETYAMRDLAHAFGVSSYPTTVFISPQGEPVASQPGFIEAASFYKMLSFVGSESYKNETFQQYSESN